MNQHRWLFSLAAGRRPFDPARDLGPHNPTTSIASMRVRFMECEVTSGVGRKRRLADGREFAPYRS
jgi:hypothetical protein